MQDFKQIISGYAANYKKLMSDYDYASEYKMPSGTYFLEDGSVLALPRDDGDSRYPYGENGFNFWTYSSGYMHCNEGLFSPFLRAAEGQEPKIAFFAGFKKPSEPGYDVVSILGVPVMNTEIEVTRYTIFSSGATLYFCEVKGLRIVLRVFIDGDNSVYFTLHTENMTRETVDVQLSYYVNPFVKNALVENSVDRWFRQAEYLEDECLGRYVVKAYEEVDRSKMAANIGIYKMSCNEIDQKAINSQSVTTSRYDFVGGSRSSLHTPRALYKGSFGKAQKICAFTETAVIAGILDVMVEDSFRLDNQFSYCFDELTKEEQLATVIRQKQIDEKLSDVMIHEKEKQSALKMSFAASEVDSLKPMVMNQFMKQVMKQVEFCSVIKGYIQLSGFSLIGIRDIFQSLEGVMYYEKDIARAKMIEALGFITKEGRCPRQYILPAEKGQTHSMDLRPFIDQGVWVISTVVNYIRFTKDYELLRVPVGYYEFIDEEKHLARQAEGEGSVLTHLIAIMDYLLSNRDEGHTECVYALYGDWNDALDGLGRSQDPNKAYGTGVSVMATLQVYQNLDEMIGLLQELNRKGLYLEEGLVVRYSEIREAIAAGLHKYAVVEENGIRKILHGWGDHRSYFVGSFSDSDQVSRDGLTSNAFWLLSDMIKTDESFKGDIIEAFRRLSSKYGFKTFEPHFEMDTEGVGRIPNLPAGTAENGAAYIHASLFGIKSLFKVGESEMAWEELMKVLPFTHERISCSPFVVPNSYGNNSTFHIDGESMADWQTGSSNVLLKLIIQYVLGFEPHYSGIYIQPAAYCPFGYSEYKIRYNETDVYVTYKKTGNTRKYYVDGKLFPGEEDQAMGIKKLWLDDALFSGGSIEITVLD